MKSKKTRIKIQVRNAQKRGKFLNPKELASCTGKIRHATYEAAANANSSKIEFVRPYKCQFCKFYHVGRRSAKKS